MIHKLDQPDMPNYDDPNAWSIDIVAGEHGYHVSLTCGVLRYGPVGGAWVRCTLKGAQRTGARALAKHTRTLQAKQLRQAALARLVANTRRSSRG